MPSNQALVLFLQISQHRMYEHYLPKLSSCIQVLSLEALWIKERNQNSIGGIVLHICEHVRRNAVRFSQHNHLGFEAGIEDYFPEFNLPTDDLNRKVTESFDEFNQVISRLIDANPSEIDMHSLYHLVEHTGYHLGQIVDRTKRASETSFQFCQSGINERNLKASIEEKK